MENKEGTGSPGWGASFFMQTTEKAVAAAAAAAAAAAVHSPRPSVVFSSKDDSGNQLQKLQRQVSRVLKGLSQPAESRTGVYNPEILTSQKRQWAKSFHLHSLVCYYSGLLDARLLVSMKSSFKSCYYYISC